MSSSLSLPSHLEHVWQLCYWVVGSDQLPEFFAHVLDTAEKKNPSCFVKKLPDHWWYQQAWDLCIGTDLSLSSKKLLIWNGLPPEAMTWLSSCTWKERWIWAWKNTLQLDISRLPEITYWNEQLLAQNLSAVEVKEKMQSSELRTFFKEKVRDPNLIPFSVSHVSKETWIKLNGTHAFRYIFPSSTNPFLLAALAITALAFMLFPLLWLGGYLPIASPFANEFSSVPHPSSNAISVNWSPNTDNTLLSLAEILTDMREDDKPLPSALPWDFKLRKGYYPLLMQWLGENGTLEKNPPLAPSDTVLSIHLTVQ